jgi:hypothetical protein
MAAHTYKGNNTGSIANPIDVTSTQLTADLNLFTSSLQGLAPSSGGGTTNFLRADGTWAAPTGTGTVTSVSVTSANGFAGTVATATTTPAITISTSITGILQGNGTAISAISTAAGTMLSATGVSTYSFTTSPTLGVNTTSNGRLLLATSVASGQSITIQNGGATTAYTFNLPTTVGTTGQFLTSQAGSAMTWTTPIVWSAGSVTLGSGITSKPVTFTTAFANTNYQVICTLVNTTDTNPQIMPITISAKSTTGFTATFADATDTVNSLLSYIATANN